MRLQSAGSSLLARPGFIQYFLAAMRLVHGVTAALPGFLLLIWLSDEPALTQSYATILLFFGVLTVMMFQALGVYSEEIFSRLLRFRMMFFAWSAAFCLLLFMHQALAMFSFMEWHFLSVWFLASLFAFGAERLVLLAIFRYWMRAGQFLQSAVILGATENGLRLAEFMQRHSDIRSGLIGFIDDRIGRLPDTLGGLPLLGDSCALERLVRQDRVTQVLVALPWSAENRIGQIVRELRKLPVNVLLVPDMLAFRHARNRITEVAGLPMFNVSERPLDGWSPLIKRIEGHCFWRCWLWLSLYL